MNKINKSDKQYNTKKKNVFKRRKQAGGRGFREILPNLVGRHNVKEGVYENPSLDRLLASVRTSPGECIFFVRVGDRLKSQKHDREQRIDHHRPNIEYRRTAASWDACINKRTESTRVKGVSRASAGRVLRL